MYKCVLTVLACNTVEKTALTLIESKEVFQAQCVVAARYDSSVSVCV